MAGLSRSPVRSRVPRGVTVSLVGTRCCGSAVISLVLGRLNGVYGGGEETAAIGVMGMSVNSPTLSASVHSG